MRKVLILTLHGTTCKVPAKDTADKGEGQDDEEADAGDCHHRAKGDRPEVWGSRDM